MGRFRAEVKATRRPLPARFPAGGFVRVVESENAAPSRRHSFSTTCSKAKQSWVARPEVLRRAWATHAIHALRSTSGRATHILAFYRVIVFIRPTSSCV